MFLFVVTSRIARDRCMLRTQGVFSISSDGDHRRTFFFSFFGGGGNFRFRDFVGNFFLLGVGRGWLDLGRDFFRYF